MTLGKTGAGEPSPRLRDPLVVGGERGAGDLVVVVSEEEEVVEAGDTSALPTRPTVGRADWSDRESPRVSLPMSPIREQPVPHQQPVISPERPNEAHYRLARRLLAGRDGLGSEDLISQSSEPRHGPELLPLPEVYMVVRTPDGAGSRDLTHQHE